MYFVNMKPDSANKVLRNGKPGIIPFVVPEGNEAIEGDVVLKDGKLMVSTVGENVFGKGFDGESTAKYHKSSLTYADVQETPENPIIVTLCDSIGLYRDVPANIKFIYMGSDCILAALIYGACEFNGVPLQRCNTTDLDTKKVSRVLSGADFARVASTIDKETGYDYLSDVCAQVHMVEKSAKDKTVNFTSSSFKSGYFFLSEQGISEAKLKKEDEKRRAEEAKAEKQAKLEADRVVAAERRRLKEEEEKAKQETKRARKELKASKNETVVSGGAEDFRNAIARLVQGV